MDEDRFRDYLPESDKRKLEHRWVDLEYERYFAGKSKTWGGAVAFLSLAPAEATSVRAKAYLVEEKELTAIVRQENGSTESLSDELQSLAPNQWTALPTPPSADGYKGKYNALLRLDDIEGREAFTLTTARRLTLGEPTPEYLALIEGALETPGPLKLMQKTTGAETNERFVTSSWDIRFKWTDRCRADRSTGFDAIRLPLSYIPAVSFSAVLAEFRSSYGSAPAWLMFSRDAGQHPLVDSTLQAAVQLKTENQGEIVSINVLRPVPLTRLPGVASDIANSDVLQVSSRDAADLGKWVLVISPTVAAPFRVSPRPHVPDGFARIGYAGRRLLGLKEDEHGQVRDGQLWIQIIPQPKSEARKHPIRRLGEFFVGAPTVALRCTEGLVGDDGERVVRVDSTALDILGVTSGDRIIVSWGWRSVGATVLLQTPSTIETMEAQLAEKTGQMARQSTGDVDARLKIPAHLRVWVSSQVRFNLQIPPDSVIRLRRSVRHTLFKHAFALALPAAGFVVAALALSRVPWYWATALSVVVILATLASIRRRTGAGRTHGPKASR